MLPYSTAIATAAGFTFHVMKSSLCIPYSKVIPGTHSGWCTLHDRGFLALSPPARRIIAVSRTLRGLLFFPRHVRDLFS